MRLFLLTFATLCAVLSPLRVNAVVLELKDQQTMAGNDVTLNDLLKSSQGLTDDDLNAVIVSSPSLGKSNTLSRADIEKLLPSDVKQQTLEWDGAASCVINRPAVPFAPADVKRLITAELATHLPQDSDFAILEIPDLDSFSIPQGQVDTSVELGLGTLRNEWGDATLKFRSQGQLAVTKSVRFHWAYTRKVWQVAERVGSRDPLTASSFQQIDVNVLKIPGQLDPAADFPDGKIAAHPLAAGKILMETDWIEPVLVTRNDIVTILYDHHGVSITVQAKAMANGVRNEVISVQNLTSHKVFNARVVNERSLVYAE